MYAWALQEKLKGLVPIFDSFEGGWGFNLADYSVDMNPDNPMASIIPIDPSEANQLTNDQIKIKPFFKKGTHIDPLLGDGGSSYSNIKANRDKLLADAFPARTLPAGLDKVSTFEGFNINIQEKYQNGWPSDREGNTRWLHSDMKDVAYLYVYELFNELVAKGVLNQ